MSARVARAAAAAAAGLAVLAAVALPIWWGWTLGRRYPAPPG